MVIIFVEHITNRVEYTFDFIFGQREIQYRLTSDVDIFNADSGARLNYSNRKFDVPTIPPSTLLFEEDYSSVPEKISDGLLEYLSFGGTKDIVASIFYVLTRMEEYTCSEFDVHGRFPFGRSILSSYDWVERAVCDRWAVHLIVHQLQLDLKIKKGDIIPTFDIDNTYAYRLKSRKRMVLSFCRDLLRRNMDGVKERLRVKNGAKDPYDTYDRIRDIARRFPKTKLFWLTRSNGAKDRNVSIKNAAHCNLIQGLSESIEVNIHPSYGSFGSIQSIQEELQDLEAITKNKIQSSRQHYLRFQLPESYQQLIALNIKNEHSMGFAEAIGFRSGTARAHFWFDLENNRVTPLKIHPFVYMDGSLLEYQNCSIEGAKQKIKQLYLEVMEYGGDFRFIWHNETIGDFGIWKGWSEVLDFTLMLENE